jgi:hypothetical protein
MTTTVNVFDQLAPVALIARRCPSTTLRRAYVKAMRDWCAETRWLRTAIPGATVIGNQTYSLGSDVYSEIIAIVAMSGIDHSGTQPQSFPLFPMDSTRWNPNVPAARPRGYQYIPEGQFALFQIPDKVYSLTVTVAIQPKDGVAQIPSEPLKKYSTGIEAGALMHLLRMPGEPWTDQKMSMHYESIWNTCISNGRAEVQRNFNSGAQRVVPRAFVMGR